MRIAVHTQAADASHGGGPVYVTALAAALAEQHRVELLFPAGTAIPDAGAFLPAFVRPDAQLTVGAAPPKAPGMLGELRQALRDRAYDAIVLHTCHFPRFTFCRNASLLTDFPLVANPSWRNRMRLQCYRRLLVNSQFTAGWMRRRWGRQATVLCPPVDHVAPLVKKPWILGVGRFLGSQRSKRQLDLVHLFRRLHESGLTGWELHLAGFVQDQAYLKQVQTAARDLPVHLHLNLSRTELNQLYGQSAIFWHAVGEGFDQETQPELMEHFGIVTVEAMSAGCVPVVINRGGQPEIVGATGEAGILWETLDECADATRKLISQETLLRAMAIRAQARAAEFAFPRFCERVRELFPAATDTGSP